jgi:predicted RNA-binding protein with PIN domain
MPFLIDGHNLIPQFPGIQLGEIDDEIKLIQKLKSFASRKKTSIEVYFDQAPPGSAGRRSYGRVTAIFVRQGDTADNAIRRRLQKLGKQAKNWTTVSNDHEVQSSARIALSPVLTSGRFAALIESAAGTDSIGEEGKQTPPISAEDLDDWMDFFTGGGETA